MQIRFKRLHADALPPFHGSEFSAGYDLTCVARSYDMGSSCWVYKTGLAVEIPGGHVGLLFPRSSVFRKPLDMAYCVGVIDADYRGEVLAIFRGLPSEKDRVYQVGERCCQLVVVPVPSVEWVESETISDTKRGTGGHGSTGDR